MALPLVAIVGRPNVGKSALFNRILGERRAIVDPMAGLTRDRLYAEADWRGRNFTIVDTAGLVLGKERDEVPALRELRRRMEEQTAVAIEEADVILLVVDVREGVTPIDSDIAELLRRARTPGVLADTAGIRRPGLTRGVEQYSLLRGLRAMERSDVALVVMDARDGITAQDQHVAGYVTEAGRGLVLVVNKWDLLSPEEKEEKEWRNRLRRAFDFAPWARVVYV